MVHQIQPNVDATLQHLMIPRAELIAPYPDMPSWLKVGDVLIQQTYIPDKCLKKQTGNLIDAEHRGDVKKRYNITSATSEITGNEFAYCEELNLHANHSKL